MFSLSKTENRSKNIEAYSEMSVQAKKTGTSESWPIGYFQATWKEKIVTYRDQALSLYYFPDPTETKALKEKALSAVDIII